MEDTLNDITKPLYISSRMEALLYHLLLLYSASPAGSESKSRGISNKIEV